MKLKMILKVCGLNDMNNINQLNNIDIDFMGFIFYNKSSRFINQHLNISNIRKQKSWSLCKRESRKY